MRLVPAAGQSQVEQGHGLSAAGADMRLESDVEWQQNRLRRQAQAHTDAHSDAHTYADRDDSPRAGTNVPIAADRDAT